LEREGLGDTEMILGGMPSVESVGSKRQHD